MSDEASKNWTKIAAGYARPSWPHALWQLANTVPPFLLLWVAVWKLSEISWWLALPVIPLASGFLIRCFIIQHDAGHASWSPNQTFNNWVGRFMGMLTFTPYAYWRRIHGIHHATSGDLDNRIAGDIPTITTQEYLARGPLGRLRYRLFRWPITLFGLGPAYQFLVKYRFPIEGLPAPRAPYLWSAVGTNVAILASLALLDPIMGWQKAVVIHLAILLPGLTLGVWLFYIQHNFENTYWRRHEDWDHATAALRGSSYYQVPPVLNWLTGDIAVHHVHHLSARIPNYRLREVLADHPELENVSRVGFLEGFRCVWLPLWDERAQKMVSFAHAHEAERRGETQPLGPPPGSPSASELA